MSKHPWLSTAAWVTGLLAIHLSIVAYFEPPSRVFGATPVFGCDFDTHVQQVWRVLEGLFGWGQTWVYDVHLLAGHPNGVIFDADNKGWEFFTYLLVRLGVRKELAFNLFVVMAHTLVVPAFYVSARLFELTRREALVAAALGSALWLFDGHLHWLWWVGTVAYVSSAYLWLVPLGLFYRFTRTRALLPGLLCAVCTALIHTHHPYSFFALALPMAILYVGMWSSASLRDHAVVAGIVVTTLAVNAVWLVPSLQHWHYILDSSIIGQSTPAQFLADFFGIVLDISTSGITPNLTTLRFTILAAAVFSLYQYRKDADPRWKPLGPTLIFLLVTAYCGGLWKVTGQIQPYRLIDPAMCLTVIPAAPLFTRLGELAKRERARWVAAPVLLAALVFLKPFTRELIGVFEDALPEMPPAWNNEPVSIIATGYKPTGVYKHILDSPDFWIFPRWLEEQGPDRGRVLVDNGVAGEQLAWKTNAEILGGFVVRNLEHSKANLFRRELDREDISHAAVRAYLEAYAVEFIVLMAPQPWLEQMSDLFEPYANVVGIRVFRSRLAISRFQQGSGQVRAVTNQITVTGTRPDEDIVLRYHFHEMLGCQPDCKVVPEKNPVGGVPFIRVPAPHPSDFKLDNTYRTSR